MLTCILAHYFLWHLKIRLGKSTVNYALADRLLLKLVLLMRKHNLDSLIEQIIESRFYPEIPKAHAWTNFRLEKRGFINFQTIVN